MLFFHCRSCSLTASRRCQLSTQCTARLQVEVHWSGYTAGYQGKRIDNTSVRDEPYRFQVGSGQVHLHLLLCLAQPQPLHHRV